uniref:Lipoprotein n=1 Tax=Roseihalotalea indica TaxID=2867963 RepID=A0AA49GJB3_9BACT|nr:hypothetical protein K4G66_22150 [Tunicatimonas sp. TK19036]
MKSIAKTLLGFTLVLCLTSACDLLNYDEIDKDQTEQAPGGSGGGGGGDDAPCRKNCE